MKTTAAKKPNLATLYRWGYAHADRNIGHITNVIQCQCGNRAKKMHGLYRLVTGGKEVRPTQFDLFSIVVDGARKPIEYLETA